MYVQNIKQGTRFALNGKAYTVTSVTYVPGYHGKYAIVAETTRGKVKLTFFAGEQVDEITDCE
jgi:translation elongation factor P/translation initiation factor 5A